MNGFELVRLQPKQVVKTGDTMTGNLTMTNNGKFIGNLQGNSDTTTRLATPRNINGVAFDGTRDITVYDNTKVSKTGDTMTGNLNMAANIVPTTNGNRDFGTANNRFQHLHLTGVINTNNGHCESMLYLFGQNDGGEGVKLALNNAAGQNLNELYYCVRNNATHLEPRYDGVPAGGSYLNSTGLGRNGKRFRDLWLVNGVIQTSDINTKENVEEIPTTSTKYKNGEITKENIYDTVKNITPIMFDYKGYENFDTNEGESFKQIGISAQELEQLNPALFKRVGTKGVIDENGVKTENYGIKTLAYTNMLLVALQESMKKIETLEKEIEDIKTKI